jgi:hypothetical protein
LSQTGTPVTLTKQILITVFPGGMMNKVLLAAMIAASALLVSNNAQAVGFGTQCMAAASCTTTTTADSGVTAKSCNAALNDCTCEEISWDYTSGRCWKIAGTCSAPWVNWGATAAGAKCCIHSTNYCLSGGGDEVEPSLEVTGPSDSGLEQVFSREVNPKLTDIYFGYANGSLRSPTNGRATSIMARLDVCMGDGDATNAVATMNANTCYNSYCGSGAINEYCNASVNNGGTVEAAGVCHDRCECAINGVAHSTCNQL